MGPRLKRYCSRSYQTLHGPFAFLILSQIYQKSHVLSQIQRKNKAHGRSDMTCTNSALAKAPRAFFNKITWKKDFLKKFWFFSWFEIGCSFWKLWCWEKWKHSSNYSRFCDAIFEISQLFYLFCFSLMACFVGCNGHIHTCDTAFESLDCVVLQKIFFRPTRIFYGSRKANNFHLWVQLTFGKANKIHPLMKIICFSGPVECSRGSEKYFLQNYAV